MRALRGALLAVIMVFVAVRAAGVRAEPVGGDDHGDHGDRGSARPWAAGVSEARQRAAQELYDAGNALLQEFLLAEAVDRYREALRHWQHPGIHYNLAKALYNLGQPLAAYDSMVEALRYGPEALQAHEYEQARNLMALLEQQTSELTVICDEPGVELALDGQALRGEAGEDGRARRRVLPGEHMLVANKPGFQTVTRRLRLAPGQRSQIVLATRQRWRPWEPWAVLGYGAAVGISGAFLQWRADSNLERYRDAFTRECPDGCRDSDVPALDPLRTRGIWQNRIGMAAMITGGTIAVAGTAMAVLNRSRSFRIRQGDTPAPNAAPAGLSIIPVVTRNVTGVLAGFTF